MKIASQVKGLQTGQYVKVYGSSMMTSGNSLTFMYDTKGRQVYNYCTSFIMSGYTAFSTKLDFSGKPEYAITTQKRGTGATALTYKDTYTYSAQDKLVSHAHKMGTGATQLLAMNAYDELGQLISKKTGGTDLTAASYYQKADYRYNIRGWLRGINDTGGLTVSGEPQDLFAFKINYNTPDGSTAPALYNGNISETLWRTSGDDVLRQYSYQYDKLNRLRNAVYEQPGVSTVNTYGESMSYDANGNIQILQRHDRMPEDLPYYKQIDDLAYSYDPDKPNQLMGVYDVSLDSGGFNDGNTGSYDYGYDESGNLILDKNKGITEITYNHLNLPHMVKWDATHYITYHYDALGTKVRKIVTDGSTVTTTEYLSGGFQYTNTVLDFVSTAEGYVKNTVIGGVNNYNYIYNYKDHLGNIRVSYGKDGGVLKVFEENNYYPFGLKHNNYNVTKQMYADVSGSVGVDECLTCPGPKNKYNGKEFQDELGLNLYDYGARNYDPAIGRWINIDPLAENHVEFNPYMYAADNPILYIDPDGKDFYIGGNIQQATEDLYSIVGDKYKLLITVGKDGRVRVDISKVSEKELKKDAGLLLLSGMDSSKNKYIYEVKETDDDGTPLNFNDGITNLSVEARMEFSLSGDIVKGGAFQGQVIIHPNFVTQTTYMDENGDIQTYTEPRGSNVFHELQENFERTENHLKYKYTKIDKRGKRVEDTKRKGAHATAIDKATNLTSKSKKAHGKEGQSNTAQIIKK